jgi:hypothetical protein
MAEITEKPVQTHVSSEPEIQEGQVHRMDSVVFSDKVPEKHDAALDFLRSTGDHEFTYTEHEATKVRRKIDFILMPLVRPSPSVISFANRWFSWLLPSP